MKISFGLIIVLVLGLFAPLATAGEAEDQIKAVMDAQAEAWNDGDIPAFMEGYWKSDDLRFASGGTITYGWAETLENYLGTYSSPEKMGKLKFSKLDIKVLSENFAHVFGRWDLKRKAAGNIGGLFTLLFEKQDGGWRIVADHTSSDDLPVAVINK